MAVSSKVLYEFGPFRVDPEKQVLLREDQPIPVTPKTFETLLILVRHSREVVSKDDLMKELWPDSFVEESNLSQNIFMLRKALGDTPEDKRYIVTLPGKGYRFAVEVRTVTQDGDDVVIGSHSRSDMVINHIGPSPVLTVPVAAPAIEKPRKLNWKHALAIAACVATVAAGAILYLRGHQPAVLGEKDSVVLADFSNTTGDPVFDETLREGLAVQLEQSPFLRIISDDNLRRTLKQMGRQPDERLNDQVAREVCERTQSKIFISGSIATLGSEFVLGLKAINCLTGETVAEQQTQVLRKEDVLNSLSRQTSILRGKLGESLASIQKFDVRLEQATTPSLEALQNYSLAMKEFYLMRYPSAGTLLHRAIELDPNFALAYARLASLNRNNQQSEDRLENSAKAYALRERVTDRERLYIVEMYYMARGETEEASQACEAWKKTYPNDAIPNTGLAVIGAETGHFDKMLEESLQAYQKDVSVLTSWNLIEAYADLGRLDDADKVLAESKARFPGNDAWLRWGYVLAFLRSDSSEMRRILEAAPSGSTLQRTILGFQFRTELYFGRQREADEYRRHVTQLSRQLGIDERAALYAAVAALQAANNGDFTETQRIAAEESPQLQAKEPLRRLALAYARSGDVRNAERVADQLARLYPTDTLLKNRDLPLVRAAIAVQQNNPLAAIKLLESAAPTELGNLDVAYTRGQAYLLLSQGTEAAAELQKIIKYRGVLLNDPPGALPYLQLARAYAMQGDAAKARVEYGDFLALWKDADPDIPIYKQAKAEYAKLP
jgi:eukaryotic-like serine/threonine-protein kinase